jgi:hypothetical protein
LVWTFALTGIAAAQPDTGPVTLHPRLDAARAVKQTISAAGGGTLTTISADGVVYTLTFPPGALLSDLAITMTPIAGIDGLPFSGGLVAGVQLEPDGLILFQPATLNLLLPNPVDPMLETPISYHGSGDGMYLYALRVDPAQTTFDILHFSGYALAQATTDERAAQLARTVKSTADDYAQQVSAILIQEREAELLGLGDNSGAWQQSVQQLAQDFYDRSIAPNLAAMASDCGSATALASTAFTWLHQAALLGLQVDRQSAAIQAAVNSGTAVCWRDAWKRCRDNSDPTEGVNMIRYDRQLELLGGANLIDSNSTVEDMQCLQMHFTLDFNSKYVLPEYGPNLLNISMQVHGRGIDLEYKPDAKHFESATVHVAWDGITYQSPRGCSSITTAGPPLYQVTLTPNLNMTSSGSHLVDLLYLTGGPGTETLVYGEPGGQGRCGSQTLSTATLGGASEAMDVDKPVTVPFGVVTEVDRTGTFGGRSYKESTSLMLTRSVP